MNTSWTQTRPGHLHWVQRIGRSSGRYPERFGRWGIRRQHCKPV